MDQKETGDFNFKLRIERTLASLDNLSEVKLKESLLPKILMELEHRKSLSGKEVRTLKWVIAANAVAALFLIGFFMLKDTDFQQNSGSDPYQEQIYSTNNIYDETN